MVENLKRKKTRLRNKFRRKWRKKNSKVRKFRIRRVKRKIRMSPKPKGGKLILYFVYVFYFVNNYSFMSFRKKN